MRRAELERGLAALATRPGLRRLAAPSYAALVEAQLAAHRALDRRRARGWSAPRDVTVLVKTFERPAVLRRLVESIRRLYPTLAVLVVDDSREPTRLPGVRTLALPFDQGLSAGRNAGLSEIDTPFFLLVDDDFVFFHGTALEPTLAVMRREPSLDVVGGRVLDLPLYRCVGTAERTALGQSGPPTRGTVGGLPRRDVVRNFFVGRTERVRAIGWDPELKLVEHADFFGRAHGVLTVAEDARLSVLHAKTPFERRYMDHRRDVARYQALLHAKWRDRL